MKNPMDMVKTKLAKLRIPRSAAAKQHEAKAAAKSAADKAVASDPNMVHATHRTVKSPQVWAGTLAGATLGAVGGPVGVGFGAGIGFIVERYRILGGPIGRLYDAAKAKIVPNKKPGG